MGKDRQQCTITYLSYRHNQVWNRDGPFSSNEKRTILEEVEAARLRGTPSADIIALGPFWKDMAKNLLGGRNPDRVRKHWADVLCKGQLPTW